eukprot:jgi/Chlat1/6973/Chrsp52S06650
MGVQGLWSLLEPVGRRVSVEALGNKRLAVACTADASIWVVQFIKAMRDDRGDMLKNAHLLGFFRRICKLLYLRVRPVFVFDGGTPALKRRTVLARRRQRDKAVSRMRKTAEKLLLNQLRARHIDERVIAEAAGLPPPPTKKRAVKKPASGSQRVPHNAPSSSQLSLPQSSNHTASDELLARSLAQEQDAQAVGQIEVKEEDEDEEDQQMFMPWLEGSTENLDPAVLAALPVSMQLEALVQLRDRRFTENREKYHQVAKAPESFSQVQMKAYLQSTRFRRHLAELQKGGNAANLPGMASGRIASEINREYLFSDNYQGDLKSLPAGAQAPLPLPSHAPSAGADEKPLSALAQAPRHARNLFTAVSSKAPPPFFSKSPLAGLGTSTLAQVPTMPVSAPDLTMDLFQEEAGLLAHASSEDDDVDNEAADPILQLNSIGDKSTLRVETPDNVAPPLPRSTHVHYSSSKEVGRQRLPEVKAIEITISDDEAPHAVIGSAAKAVSPQADDDGIDWEDAVADQDGKVGTNTGSDIDWKDASADELREVIKNVTCQEQAKATEPDWEDAPAETSGDVEERAVEHALAHVHLEDAEDRTGTNIGIAMQSQAVVDQTEKQQLQEALRRSLEDSQQVAHDVAADSEEQELQKAIQLSLADAPHADGRKPGITISEKRPQRLPDTHPSHSIAAAEDDYRRKGKAKLIHDQNTTLEQPFYQLPDKYATPKPISQNQNMPAGVVEDMGESDIAATGNGDMAKNLNENLAGDTALDTQELRQQLAAEATSLKAKHRTDEKAAESVTVEMLAECQELLQVGVLNASRPWNTSAKSANIAITFGRQMFGLPYVIAPMEAEAQCAALESLGLVDGTVTDDCDVFLFGGRAVYRNIFDQKKYVEHYQMSDVERELGMDRDKLIFLALLLGSDYTEGVSGVGIVNAMETISAFPGIEGLRKYADWVKAPDMTLLDPPAVAEETHDNGGGNLSDVQHLACLQRIFKHKHKGARKNWELPALFPSPNVVEAYRTPQVDDSKESFSWGRPDLDVLRQLCRNKFGWQDAKADEVLIPVLKAYDARETQLRMEHFFGFTQRFAKVRSKRIQKALAHATNARNAANLSLTEHEENPLMHSPSKAKAAPKALLPATQDTLPADLPLVKDAVATHKGKGRKTVAKGRPRSANAAKEDSPHLLSGLTDSEAERRPASAPQPMPARRSTRTTRKVHYVESGSDKEGEADQASLPSQRRDSLSKAPAQQLALADTARIAPPTLAGSPPMPASPTIPTPTGGINAGGGGFVTAEEDRAVQKQARKRRTADPFAKWAKANGGRHDTRMATSPQAQIPQLSPGSGGLHESPWTAQRTEGVDTTLAVVPSAAPAAPPLSPSPFLPQAQLPEQHSNGALALTPMSEAVSAPVLGSSLLQASTEGSGPPVSGDPVEEFEGPLVLGRLRGMPTLKRRKQSST